VEVLPTGTRHFDRDRRTVTAADKIFLCRLL